MKIVINQDLALVSPDRHSISWLVKYLNDGDIYTNTLKIPKDYGRNDALKFFNFCKRQHSKIGMENNLMVLHQPSGEIIGGIGSWLKYGIDAHKDEIGYWLAKPYRNKGYTTVVVKNYCHYLFEKRPSLERIEAGIFLHNIASQKVLSKCGFSYEGIMRNEALKDGMLHDTAWYSLLRQDFYEKQNRNIR
ncbi:MAG: GNAT family N-acetyltransferase [Bacteroidetes bacterium]|nr:GNAT family N-acetyltransferase [Bacteroidota bacterium]